MMDKMIHKRKKVIKLSGDEYIIYQFPLDISMLGFEKLTKALGGPFIDIISVFFINFKSSQTNEHILSAMQKNLSKESFSSLRDMLINLKPGEMQEFVEFFIKRPDYVKRNGKGVNIIEIHELHGLKHLFELTFNVISFNYFDFLSPGKDMK